MDGEVQKKAHMAAFKAIVKRTKTQNRRDGSSPISFDMNATSPNKTVCSYLVTRTSSITNTLQGSTVVTIDEGLRNPEYDVGLNLDGALGWLDPVYHPQHYAIDFSDISLDPEQHDRNYDALSPLSTETSDLSTETLDHFRTSLTRTVVDDVPFEKLMDDSMQTLPLNHAIAMSASQPASQQGVLLTPLETPSSESAHNRGAGLPVPTIPATKVLPPELTQEEQRAWQYYTEVILPSMFLFLPLESAQHECTKALKACQSSASCLRQIVSQTEQFQASELKRFGLRNSRGPVSGQENHEHTMMLQRYGSFNQDCLLHILMAQVSTYKVFNCEPHVLTSQINLGGNEWPGVVEWLSRNISALEGTCRESHFSKEILSYLEVLASTMTGGQPNLAIRHMACIDNSIALECVTGVESWLLKCLIQIIQLRKWKSDQLSKASLSMLELMKSSLAIENDLKRERACSRPGKYPSDSARSAFMKVFESAIAVFLQCTVSEPRPEIIEIQQEVAKTTDALKNLPQASLLKRLAWPVCIAASMAIEADQQEFFKTLHERLKTAWGLEENICRALTAAFECWRLRESAPTGKTYDWTDGMKSLGYFWLLF